MIHLSKIKFHKRLIAFILLMLLVMGPKTLALPEYVLNLSEDVSFVSDNKRINFHADDADVKQTIRLLCNNAGINVIFDESVEGSVTLDLDNVSIRDALMYIRASAGLYYRKKGENILIVSSTGEASRKGINTYLTKIIPVKYINSKLAEKILETSLFAGQGKEDEGSSKIINEFRTNSVIVVGSESDIQHAQDFLRVFDIPRASKSFKLNNSDPIRVASILSSTVFNDGIAPFNGESSGSEASKLKVLAETFQEGSGSSEVSSQKEGSSTSLTVRSTSLSEETISISPEGPIIVPDTRTSTITILGTEDQIQLVENILPALDRRLEQVSIETSLIEVNTDGIRELNARLGSSDGQFASSFNNQLSPSVGPNNPAIQPLQDLTFTQVTTDPTTGAISTNDVTITNGLGLRNNVIGFPTIVNSSLNGVGGGAAFTTVPLERSSQVLFQLNSLLTSKKAKILANPTIVAMHNTESIISIVDEIVRSQTVTRDATGFTQTQTEIGEAGIVLSVIPKIGEDHFVTMRLRPSVSSIRAVVPDPVTGSITTLLTRRDLALQEVRVKDGNTLALGGLINETDSTTVSKVPFLADLPVVGALFRASQKEGLKQEIIMLLTPNILPEGQTVGNLSLLANHLKTRS